MIIKSLELENFRNYDSLSLNFDSKTNILYGDNAQGKTNVLEAIYLSSTTKSHKGSKDKDIINSAGTLIYLSGRANELKSLLDSDERLVNARLNLKSKMDNNSAIYGTKEPQIPTLKELEAEAERRYEEYKRIESNLSEADLDMMETHARLNYL